MLTVGVLLDGPQQEGWALDALRRVASLNFARIEAVIIAPSPGDGPGRPRRWLDALDHRLRTRSEPYFRYVDIARGLGLKARVLPPSGRNGDWYFGPDRCKILRKAAVDVWLCVGQRTPRFVESDISERGAWCLEIGDGVQAASIDAGATEIIAGASATSIAVVDRAVTPARVLLRGFGATEKNSLRRSRLNAILKGSCYWYRLLARLNPGCAVDVALPDGYPQRRPVTAPALAAAIGKQILVNQWRMRFWRRQWQMAIGFDSGALRPGGKAQRMVPPRDRFWADPFALQVDDRYYILFEELEYREGKGRLMAVEVFEDGRRGEPVPMLEEPWHLSYPFVFRWQGDLYLLPESADSGRVQLYRCRRFPDDWEPVKVLLDKVTAFDATLWQQDDTWWMFVCIAAPGAVDGDELHLYYADNPLGPWEAHVANPVMSDARRARPAGPLFERNGVLYRPSQDCAPDYGYAVNLNRVDELSKDAYRETVVDRVTPATLRRAHCVHTVGRHGRMRVMDYQVWRPRFLG